MPRKINLIGQKFNQLLVIAETDKRSAAGAILWKCQCDCGNITFATSTDLKSGHKKSCGCLQKERAKELGLNNIIDLTGQKFGYLTVLSKEPSKTMPNGSTKAMWKCKCECGNIVTICSQSLKSGNTQSCGCIKSLGEKRISEILRYNNIPFQKEWIFEDFKPYRFDFFVDSKYVIEYDGKQHFNDYSWGSTKYKKKDVQDRDNLKNNYCLSHNIPIIRIPYTHYNELNIKDLLLETSKFTIEL